MTDCVKIKLEMRLLKDGTSLINSATSLDVCGHHSSISLMSASHSVQLFYCCWRSIMEPSVIRYCCICESNAHMTDDVTRPQKVKVMTPVCLGPNIWKIAVQRCCLATIVNY